MSDHDTLPPYHSLYLDDTRSSLHDIYFSLVALRNNVDNRYRSAYVAGKLDESRDLLACLKDLDELARVAKRSLQHVSDVSDSNPAYIP